MIIRQGKIADAAPNSADIERAPISESTHVSAPEFVLRLYICCHTPLEEIAMASRL